MKNVVFITVDSLRADYVFGTEARESLETLPRLTDDWLSFRNAFSNAPYTKQSFLSILSGTYPWMFDSEQDGYELNRPHVAEILSKHGYSTAGFHTNTYLSPTYNYDRGFDYYMGRDSSDGNSGGSVTNTMYNRLVERAVATEGLSDIIHAGYKTAGKHFGVQLGSSLYKPAEALNDAVIGWAESSSKPLFVWAHYMDVHNPYYPHQGTVSEDVSRREAIKLFHRVNEQHGDAPESDIATLERLYRGEIQYFDRQLGDLLDRLDETLGLENTLVVFTSDHGEAFNEKGHVFHPGSALYDENIHVPVLIGGAGIQQGDVETPVSNVDLVATILSEVGINPPPSITGENLSMFGAQPPSDRLVFTESFSRADGGIMVTDGRFKLIRDLDTGEETLYDRHEEPREVHNRLEAYPEKHDELATAIDEHIRSVGETEGQGADVEVTEDVRLQLRKLGYDE
ncbi:sulfatase [Natronomonas amylolytica]|uniref:sulfatase n=1 Tax=Natronomonas amylolytica TaxID=3108498 RepID=UPI00300AB500